MTTAEVADYLRLKERTVYEMAGKRQLPCTRATGKLLFSRRLIERWVEAHTETPAGYDSAPPPIYAGSSDPLLEWALRESGSGLATLTAGSAEGIERLARGEAVLAGAHLYDPETRRYNAPVIARRAPFPDIVAIRFAVRRAGLLVAKGNPLGLATLDDCVARRARFAVRPAATGTRQLLDALLAEMGQATGALALVAHEAQTQGDLAVMIAEGDADCGLGVEAAARRGGLDFVPLGVDEEFDLVMRRRDYFEPPVQKLLAFGRDPAFARRAVALGGYDVSTFGVVTYNA
ncbi:MAG: helix-turn-helix domain-containing protein [Salinarimonadaceae bacterium]|nr:MAG: helix-turn-helix domain-containing protein [Salinarimonadaceae bacterium]